MKIIKASFVIEDDIDGDRILKAIEKAGRTCYQSSWRITETSAPEFVKMIMRRGHLSVLEHEKATVRLIVDRGVTHEIVRHRLASYSQESTRFCNYMKEKFGAEIKVIEPCFWLPESELYSIWLEAMKAAEGFYARLMGAGAKAEEARTVLPNSLKTEIVMTMNLREWRHFFALRTAKVAHPQMREITCPMLEEFRKLIPVVFDWPLSPEEKLKVTEELARELLSGLSGDDDLDKIIEARRAST